MVGGNIVPAPWPFSGESFLAALRAERRRLSHAALGSEMGNRVMGRSARH